MIVKIGDKIYDTNQEGCEPIMLVMSDSDKKLINDMLPESTKLLYFDSNKMTEEEARKFMDISDNYKKIGNAFFRKCEEGLEIQEQHIGYCNIEWDLSKGKMNMEFVGNFKLTQHLIDRIQSKYSSIVQQNPSMTYVVWIFDSEVDNVAIADQEVDFLGYQKLKRMGLVR